MKSWYSIIYSHPNAYSAEQIACGLLVVNPTGILFEYDEEKLDIVSKLSLIDIKAHLKQSFYNLKLTVKKLNEENQKAEVQFFMEPKLLFQQSYGNYLHKYSHGIIQYSEPNPVASEVSKEKFNILFEKFIGPKKKDKGTFNKNLFHNSFKKKLANPSLKAKVDIDLKLTPQKLEGIYTETNVRLIGKNGVITAVNDLDFTVSTETLGTHLNEWDVLVNALNTFSAEKKWKKGEYHIVFNKPKAKSIQEKIFNNIIESKKGMYHLTSFDEVDSIIEKIEKNEYSPISMFL
ncbi:MAG: hypothetical protein ABI390_02320 [Daejeonella sp.]